MPVEKGDLTLGAVEKKAYQTPMLLTHGSVAKLTQHDGCNGGHSEFTPDPSCGPHHRHRWWDCL